MHLFPLAVAGLLACDILARASRECQSMPNRAASLARNCLAYVVEASWVDCLNQNVQYYVGEIPKTGQSGSLRQILIWVVKGKSW